MGFIRSKKSIANISVVQISRQYSVEISRLFSDLILTHVYICYNTRWQASQKREYLLATDVSSSQRVILNTL